MGLLFVCEDKHKWALNESGKSFSEEVAMVVGKLFVDDSVLVQNILRRNDSRPKSIEHYQKCYSGQDILDAEVFLL